MIIDAFMFHDEHEILTGRLEYLYDVVDYFVLVEADLTHSGKLKTMEYARNMSKYDKYKDKIIYCPFTYYPAKYDATKIIPRSVNYGSDAFAREADQRNHISYALNRFRPEDIVMVSDVDEIPSKRAIHEAVQLLQTYYVGYALLQEHYTFNLHQKEPALWRGTVIATNKWIHQATPQRTRLNREFPTIENGGWHLTYWGGVDKIQNKLNSYSHQELNLKEINNRKFIESRLRSQKELFTDRKLESVDVGQIYLHHKDFFNIFAKYSVPMPDYYHLVEGWFDGQAVELYRNIVKNIPSPCHVVEVGSWKGRSASLMAVELINSGKTFKFDCVDTWEGSEEHKEGQSFYDADIANGTLFESFSANMKPVEGIYTAIRLPSVEAAKQYEDGSLDFVFIDAAHDYDNVLADLKAWTPKLKKSGIMAGHDLWHIDVRRAVTEFFLHFGETSDGSCWFIDNWV